MQQTGAGPASGTLINSLFQDGKAIELLVEAVEEASIPQLT